MRKIYFFLFLFFCFWSPSVLGQAAGDYVAKTSMEWNGGTWSLSDGAGGYTGTTTTAPTSAKNVFILDGATVTVTTTAATCKNLTISGLATFNPAVGVTISGLLEMDGTLNTGSSAPITVNGNSSILGNWITNNTLTFKGDVLIGPAGTLKGQGNNGASVQSIFFSGASSMITVNGQLGGSATGATGESLRLYAGATGTVTTTTFNGTGKIFVDRFQANTTTSTQTINIDIDMNINNNQINATGLSLQSGTGAKILNLYAGRTIKFTNANAGFHSLGNATETGSTANTTAYGDMIYNIDGTLDISLAHFAFYSSNNTNTINTSAALTLNVGSTGVIKLGANVRMAKLIPTQQVTINVASGGTIDGSASALGLALSNPATNGTASADKVWFTLSPGAILKRLVTAGGAAPMWIGPTNNNYNPVTINPSVTTVFTVGVSTGINPVAGLNSAKAINMTWTVSPATPSATALTFGYNGTGVGNGDANSSCDPTTAMKLWFNNGSNWSLITPSAVTPLNGVQTDRTVTFAGVASFSTFALVNDFVPSANANLSSLATSSGVLSPVFSSGNLNYSTSVNSSAITVTPTTADGFSSVTVNGVAVSSGASSASIPLTVGLNTITIVVTAQDGVTSQSYILTVTRNANNAALNGLTLSAGTLSPAFASSVISYSAEVANAIQTITLTPTVADLNATVSVNGLPTTSGNPSAVITLNVGVNNITVIATAQDGLTTTTYNIVVTRDPSANANLSGLSLSSGTLSPVFASGVNSYSATVMDTVSAITVTPISADPNAVISVNGTAVISGSASGTIPLNVGNNTISVVVKAQDGITVNNYSAVITRLKSSNADLTSLVLSTGTLTPVFSASTTSYTVSVGNAINSLTVTPTVADINTQVTVNGNAVSTGSPSGSIPLLAGSNTINLVATAPDGTQKNYTVLVNRAFSSDANLSGLTLSTGPLIPVFSTASTTYSQSVSISTASVMITPVVEDANAVVTINTVTVPSGTPSSAIPLNIGNNTITIAVKAQDGTTKNYTIIIVKTSASANANLSALALSSGSLTPVFSAGITNYTASVTNAIASLSITPTLADATATVKINGVNVASSASSAAIPLTVGNNVINITTIAQDGITTINYKVTVTRAASSNAGLAALALSSGILNPVFATGTLTYNVSVSNTVSSLTITPTLADATAMVSINGILVSNLTPSGPQALIVGNNTINVVTLAQDGLTSLTYRIIVNRAPSTVAALSAISLSSGILSPSYAQGTLTYTASVPNTTTSLTITPVESDGTATVTVNGTAVANGTASSPIVLSVGNNVISVISLAQDGTTKVTYNITVNRAASSNANLSALALNSGTLSPVFASGTLTYSTSVSNSTSSIIITPTLADMTAALTVNGVPVTSGSASAPVILSVGSNIVQVMVTAADGTRQTYSLTIIRAKTPQTITFPPLASMSYGAADFNAGTTSTNPTIPVTYTSNNTAVATVSPSGVVHITGAGTTTITAFQASNATFDAATTVAQTLIVFPAPLTVTANNQTRPYFISNPALTFTYAGFVNGETNNVLATIPVPSTTATSTSPVGIYPITISGGASANYTLTYVPATLTITPANRVITFNGLPAKTFGDPDFSAGAITSNGDIVIYSSSNTAVATILNGQVHIVGAGTAVITASLAATANYTAQQASQVLLVNQAAQTISFSQVPDQLKGNIYLTDARASSGLQVVLTSSDNSIIIPFSLDLKAIDYGTVIITATQAGNANYLPVTVTQQVNVPTPASIADLVQVHSGVSPNGDGVNDFLIIDNVRKFPDNKFTLVDRNGVKLFQINGYDNDTKVFDGHGSNGSLLAMGTYFYVLEFKSAGTNIRKVGYIILKNQ